MTDNDSARIGLRTEGPVAIVTIANARRRNAFTFQMLQDIPRIFGELERNPEILAIVLEGDGDTAFAAGDDINEFAQHRSTQADEAVFMATALAAFNAPAACSKPVVAAVAGFCFGGGMQLAAACDVRICGQGARFSVPATKLGVGYPMAGIARFVELVGAANTSKIFLAGRMLSCEEIAATGFATDVVADEQVKPAAYAYAAELAERAPLSVRALKATIAACASGDHDQKEQASALIAQCPLSADFVEGRNAFLQKRKAVFKGA